MPVKYVIYGDHPVRHDPQRAPIAAQARAPEDSLGPDTSHPAASTDALTPARNLGGPRLASLPLQPHRPGTPGPSNALLTAIGARVGIRQGLASLLGQVAAMGAMLFAITLGLGGVLLGHPVVLQVLGWGGAAVLCWMAWRIAAAGHAEGAVDATTGFFGMAAFQWVNSKGWLIGVAAIPAFLGRGGGSALAQAVVLALLFSLAALPSCLP